MGSIKPPKGGFLLTPISIIVAELATLDQKELFVYNSGTVKTRS